MFFCAIFRSTTANSLLYTRNDIDKNGVTYLIENIIGVLEFSSVPESYTITRSFENIYFFYYTHFIQYFLWHLLCSRTENILYRVAWTASV